MNQTTTEIRESLSAPIPAAAAAPAATAAAPIYPPAYQSLMAVGLLGSIYGPADDADAVNDLVELTLPDPVAYRMHRALAVGLSGNAKRATEILLPIVEANPQDDAAKVALAVSKMLGGDPEWESLLENVLASGTDPAAREAARNVIATLLSMNT